MREMDGLARGVGIALALLGAAGSPPAGEDAAWRTASGGTAAGSAAAEEVRRLVASGVAALRGGDPLAAVERLREALRLDPGSGEAHLHLGDAYRRLGLRERARAEYEAGLEAGPGRGGPRVDLLWSLGIVEAEDSRFQRAAGHFEEAIRLEPRRADLLFNLGKAYQELARFDEALRSFEEAVRLEPKDPEAAAALANLLLMRGQAAKGIEVLSPALAARPDHPEACYRMGMALAKEGRTAQAVAYFERAVRADAEHEGAWLNLARSAESAGDARRSREAYARFRSLYEKSRAAEAEANRRARAIDREVPGLYRRSQALAGEGRWEEAIGEFEKILALQPGDAPTLLNIGRLYATMGEGGRARGFLERSAAADPGYADPNLDLARLERSSGRPREALARAERALALRPDLGEAWLLKGILLAEAGEWGASVPALEESSRRLPSSPEPESWLARAYERLGRAAEAQRAKRRAAERAASAPAGPQAPGPQAPAPSAPPRPEGGRP